MLCYEAALQKVISNSAVQDDSRVHWDANGPNGADTEPNSLSFLIKWWSTEGNYSKFCRGKNNSGKAEEAILQALSDEIKKAGILVE